MQRRLGHVFLFIDTSAITNGLPFEQGQWASAFGAESATLVLPCTVIHELDKLKDRAEGRTQARARDFNSKLRGYGLKNLLTREGVHVHDNLSLRVLAEEPDMAAEISLDPAVADDRIIAEILHFARPGANLDACRLVAADTAIQLKALRLGIEALQLPEALALTTEPTEAERELKKVRRELDRLEGALPALDLELFTRTESGTVVDVRLRRMGVVDDEFQSRIRIEESRIGGLETVRLALMRDDQRLLNVAKGYFEAFPKTLAEMIVLEKERGRVCHLGVSVANTGSAIAQVAEVDLLFPADFAIGFHTHGLRRKSFPRLRSVGAALEQMQLPYEEEVDRELNFFAEEPVVAGNRVTYSIRDLMHQGPRQQLRALVAMVPTEWDGEGFAIQTTIRAAGRIEPKTGSLQVRVVWHDASPYAGFDIAEAESLERQKRSL